MSDTRRRALVAAFIGGVGASVGIAGAGHAYLREWRRAVAWFTFVLGVGLVLLSVFTDPMSLTLATIDEVPVEVTAPMAVLFFLSTFDAYYVASRKSQESDSLRCPVCRGKLDPQVTFCPWCATEFESRPRPPEELDVDYVQEAE
ncbi:zinc ribbon domain-containing protein [Halogeometricum borinquense]|uniref:Zinc ribbon domain-containing protein n=1 Tax=Halogeometricum borinquense TaxID=60847 RepID=A0A6C0UHW0_9EURY|nr:zinc ribbon domain-containing protein [Halogeometricum borinquense]QIB73409.1 zinc ribbon domain-containing protein [Halogeometricum borinquense]QIQ77190.1 zinc ribbon domain-containing protein [Halogeometricum borinquense]